MQFHNDLAATSRGTFSVGEILTESRFRSLSHVSEKPVHQTGCAKKNVAESVLSLLQIFFFLFIIVIFFVIVITMRLF